MSSPRPGDKSVFPLKGSQGADGGEWQAPEEEARRWPRTRGCSACQAGGRQEAAAFPPGWAPSFFQPYPAGGKACARSGSDQDWNRIGGTSSGAQGEKARLESNREN